MSELAHGLQVHTAEMTLSTTPEIPAQDGRDFSLTKEGRRAAMFNRGFSRYDGPGEIKLECLGLETPTDELTGLPLATALIEPPCSGADESFTDFHHQFHPRAVMESRDDAALAVRISRGQQLPRWLHSHYHGYFAGPRLPESRKQAFTTCVLACAGVIPRQIIDFYNDGPEIRSAGHSEYETIAKTIRHEGSQRWDRGRFQRNRIGIFFANYAVEQAIEDEIPERKIDEFLHTNNEEVRLKLGNQMLRQAVGMSVDPVRPLFRLLRKDGLATRDINDLWPVVTEYFVSQRLPEYHIALMERFKASAA